MKKLIIATGLLILPIICYAADGCNPKYDYCFENSQTWTQTDTALLVVTNILSWIDYRTTRKMNNVRYPGGIRRWSEEDPLITPFIGTDPPNGKLDIAAPLIMIGASVLSYYLPNPYRDIFLGGWISIEGYMINNERTEGMSIHIRYMF